MPYFEDGELSSLARYAPSGKTWPLPLSDARSISGQILSGTQYLHDEGYMHRDLKPRNILLRSLDPLEVVICDHGLAQKASRATTRVSSGLWTAPECRLSEAGHGPPVDVYSMGVILLWLLGVYAEDGEYANEREYDKLFGDTIRRAINSSNSPQKTAALSIGQRMAAYSPTKWPTIQQCWESDLFDIREPPPVKQVMDQTAAAESTGVKAEKEGPEEPIHKTQTLHTNKHLQVRTTSVLAQSSKGSAGLGIQQPARVQKSRSKVPISDKFLDALSRTSLMKDT